MKNIFRVLACLVAFTTSLAAQDQTYSRAIVSIKVNGAGLESVTPPTNYSFTGSALTMSKASGGQNYVPALVYFWESNFANAPAKAMLNHCFQLSMIALTTNAGPGMAEKDKYLLFLEGDAVYSSAPVGLPERWGFKSILGCRLGKQG